MVIVLGRIEVHPDDADAAAALAAALQRETLAEAGCLHYAFGRDLGEPGRFWLSERWRDPTALAEHFRTPHMARFRARIGRLRVSHVSATSYEVTAGNELIAR